LLPAPGSGRGPRHIHSTDFLSSPSCTSCAALAKKRSSKSMEDARFGEKNMSTCLSGVLWRRVQAPYKPRWFAIHSPIAHSQPISPIALLQRLVLLRSLQASPIHGSPCKVSSSRHGRSWMAMQALYSVVSPATRYPPLVSRNAKDVRVGFAWSTSSTVKRRPTNAHVPSLAGSGSLKLIPLCYTAHSIHRPASSNWSSAGGSPKQVLSASRTVTVVIVIIMIIIKSFFSRPLQIRPPRGLRRERRHIIGFRDKS
jgi:hypothetical protein